MIPSVAALADDGNVTVSSAGSTGELVQTARVETIAGLDLSVPLIAETPDGEPPSGRALRIASCYEASLGRYHSESSRVFTRAPAGPGSFDLALSDYYARKQSRAQFEACSSY